MKLNDFKNLIHLAPSGFIKEHIFVLMGKHTKQFEDVLQDTGCKESDWNDFYQEQYSLGTYLILNKNDKDDTFPHNVSDYIMTHAVLCIDCEPAYNDMFAYIMDKVKSEWKTQTGEDIIPYDDWSDSIKVWFNNHIEDKDFANKFVTGVITGEIL